MHPQQPQMPHPGSEQPQPLHNLGSDPTKSSRSLAIALVVSGVLLLAAVGVVVWLIVNSGSLVGKSITHVTPPDDTKDVKNVSFAAPANLPPNYAKNDQSKLETTNIYYYDDATNCGMTVGVIPLPDGKTVKDSIVDAAAAAATQGVTTTKSTQSDSYKLPDAADTKKVYSFDAVQLEQDVNVPGVGFTKQTNVIVYKQFGAQVASLSYACKAETWAEKMPELQALVKTFTVKTER